LYPQQIKFIRDQAREHGIKKSEALRHLLRVAKASVRKADVHANAEIISNALIQMGHLVRSGSELGDLVARMKTASNGIGDATGK